MLHAFSWSPRGRRNACIRRRAGRPSGASTHSCQLSFVKGRLDSSPRPGSMSRAQPLLRRRHTLLDPEATCLRNRASPIHGVRLQPDCCSNPHRQYHRSGVRKQHNCLSLYSSMLRFFENQLWLKFGAPPSSGTFSPAGIHCKHGRDFSFVENCPRCIGFSSTNVAETCAIFA